MRAPGERGALRATQKLVSKQPAVMMFQTRGIVLIAQ